MITKDREYRMFSYETVEDEEKPNQMKVRGTAILFDTPTVLYERDGIKYYEKIDRNSLTEAMMSDVVFNMNHVGPAAAKTRNKTLSLTVTPNGLDFEADLSKNATGRDIYERIESSFLEEMSFAFTVTDEAYDKETRTRTIKKIDRLFDVSAVDNGAYSNTVLELDKRQRSFFAAEAEKELAEARELELEKDKLELELDLYE
ncbi:MAG TPA: HK97 family phage prohead protease [Dysgonamonadaceae bacterium]|nr:HK97 family phage prohead protease [Dysgonamonadaceae bacterium]